MAYSEGAYYRRVALPASINRSTDRDECAPDSMYLDKIQDLLSAFPNIGVPPEPTMIVGDVLLGTSANAENIAMLKALNVSYLLNCAGTGSIYQFKRVKDMYTPETGILGYQELIIEDDEDLNVRPYMEKAHQYINQARGKGRRVLIFCPGVSRSGVIALAYMVRCNIPLLESTKLLKDKRRVVLTNEGFMKQLVQFARERGMLDLDVHHFRAPKYGGAHDRHRIISAHLPTFI